MARTVFLDCSAGVSGDLVVSALLDLGMTQKDLDRVAAAAQKACQGWCGKIEARRVVRRDPVLGCGLDLRIEEKAGARSVREVRAAVAKCAKLLGFPDGAARLALAAVGTINWAEASVHGVPARDIHLHELGSADTVFDICAAIYGLRKLGLLEADIVRTRLAVGSGSVRTAHGLMQVPVPVVSRILAKEKIGFSSGGEGELATPTGVSLALSIAPREASLEGRILRIGQGIGWRGRTFRIVVAEGAPSSGAAPAGAEEIGVIETNLDDVDGELIGYVGKRLMAEGALDFSVLQGIGKKGRPVFAVKLICRWEDSERLARRLIEESGTGGVRISSCRMLMAQRSYERRGKVVVKKFFLDGVEVSRKAEHDTAEAEARRTGKTLRQVRKEALS